MYWVGLILALISGLLSIELFRNFIRNFIPLISNEQFDKARIVFLVVGLSLATVKYFIDQYEIRTLKNQVDLVKYQEIADYNANGNKSGAVFGVRMVPTPIDDWNKDFVVRREGRIVCKCSPSAITQCRMVIDKLPLYPFSYYFLAVCLKENGDQSWIEYAKKAKSILEKTTKLSSHHSDHDQILNEVNKLFRN